MAERIDINYIPGKRIQGFQPLDRYLPPTWKGVASTWLTNNIPKGSWLLDPFGASPQLVIEAAQNGYRVIVTANNPVTRFILEVMCNPPSPPDFQAAIAMLASSQVGNERLEPHIKSLYETICQECSHKIQAKTFLWKRGDNAPYARIYHCPYCGDAGERPINSFDIEKAERFLKSSLHRARALERVAPLRDPDRRHVEEALEVYLPRAIYALVTIINKLSSIPDTHPNHRSLCAMLLLAFDRANTLWLYPKERQRPRQLTVPAFFREHNIWEALESAVELWKPSDVSVPLAKWPQPPPQEGGICLFEGRIKELATNLPKIDVSAVLTAFPRPNQAFWTLSALWSGWLWGPEAVEHFKSVLRRRRYDWGWHTNAIQTALNSLSSGLPENTPYFGLIGEAESGFLSAVLLGSQLAGLKLCGMALRTEDAQAQITWRHPSKEFKSDQENPNFEKSICYSTQEYLREQRGEPSSYLYLHTAGLIALVKTPFRNDPKSPSEYLSQVQSAFQPALSYRNGFLRYDGSAKSLEVGQWWLQNPQLKTLPLADRVEKAIVNYLIKNPGSTFSEIDTAICQIFPGLTPPVIEMVQVCLESYAYQESSEGDLWFIQEGDAPDKRRSDILEMEAILINLGRYLNFDIITNASAPVIQWNSKKNQLKYNINISASAVLGKYLIPSQSNPNKSLIVLPGSRSNLVAYKLRQNAFLQEIVDQGWRFIKFRHLRRLAESPTLNIENLDEQLSLDPLTYSKPQIRLL